MNRKVVIAIILFILTAALLSININKPFYGIHDWNGARYGNIARNYLRYGAVNVNFGQVENAGVVKKKDYIYYTHYPPTLPLLIASSYTIFGISEWSTRLIPILATAGIIVLIFLIGAFLNNISFGLAAALLSLSTPLVLYFGKNPVHEPVVLFLALLGFYFYLLKRKTSKVAFKLFFVVSVILAELTAWAGYFLVPAITLVAILKKDFREVKQIMPLFLLSVGVFIIYVLYTKSLVGVTEGGTLETAFFDRTNFSAISQITLLNVFDYLNRLGLWFVSLFSWILVLLSLIWIITFRFKKMTYLEWNVLILGLIGVFYAVIFSKILYIHNYLTFYFLPFFALSAVAGIKYLTDKFHLEKFKLLVITLILISVILERWDFLQTLDKSNQDKFAFEVAQELRRIKSTDTILISDQNFYIAGQYFMKFYSDRNLVSAGSSDTKVDVVVVVDTKNQTFEIKR